jgi:hypothetical protein
MIGRIHQILELALPPADGDVSLPAAAAHVGWADEDAIPGGDDVPPAAAAAADVKAEAPK